MKNIELKHIYFSHDIYADKDEKIMKMFYFFRKNIDEFSEEFLKQNFFHAAFGLFWEIVQYMHRNELTVDEIPMLADALRADEKFTRLILEKFNLFRIEDGKIISDRILRNINEIRERQTKAKNSAQTRWLLSAFKKSYEEFFGEEPILQAEEIEALKNYEKQIPDFKEKIRDILYTLKGLKFDTDVNFKPCANWLLTKNNLARLVNGEFGKLKHKETEEEIKERAKKQAELEKEKNQPAEIEIKCKACPNKENALKLIKDYYANQNVTVKNNRIYILPVFRNLAEKFHINDSEILRMCNRDTT